MQWQWEDASQGALRLIEATEAERKQALWAIRDVSGVGTELATTTGGRLEEALAAGTLAWHDLKTISAWCHPEGSPGRIVDPARRLSRALFSGDLLPRLTPKRAERLPESDARGRFGEFAEKKGFLLAGTVDDGTRAAKAAAEAAETFPVLAPGGAEIHSPEEWFSLAPPPKGEVQWVDGKSPKELARRWLAGGVPAEVRRHLDGNPIFRGFRPVRAYAEARTPIDEHRGNPSPQDLVVVGEIAARRLLIDVEGKTDETFGPTIADALASADRFRQENPASRLRDRIEGLAAGIFGVAPEEVGTLRYQLLYGVAAALVRARMEETGTALFLVHELRSPALSAKKLERNRLDLEAFVTRLGGKPTALAKGLAGPMKVAGGHGIPADIPLFMGKASYVLPRG